MTSLGHSRIDLSVATHELPAPLYCESTQIYFNATVFSLGSVIGMIKEWKREKIKVDSAETGTSKDKSHVRN